MTTVLPCPFVALVYGSNSRLLGGRAFPTFQQAEHECIKQMEGDPGAKAYVAHITAEYVRDGITRNDVVLP